VTEFTNVKALEGGVQAWLDAGYPMHAGTP
jgi:rhodanese-related sulfurtransferase